MVVTVIGLGLIGGSMAIDMKNSGFASKIIGVDSSKINAEFAVNIGFVDVVEPLLSAISKSSHVLAALPKTENCQSIRFSFSRHTTKEEIDFTLEKIKELTTISV